MRRRTASLALLALPSLLARAAQAGPSSSASAVTIYGASWCGPCHRLQDALRERGVPYDYIDVDRYPELHDRAKQATGTSAIPVTSVARGSTLSWFVGADADAIERAYRG